MQMLKQRSHSITINNNNDPAIQRIETIKHKKPTYTCKGIRRPPIKGDSSLIIMIQDRGSFWVVKGSEYAFGRLDPGMGQVTSHLVYMATDLKYEIDR